MFRDGLLRVSSDLGDGRKGVWLLPVFFVLILWVILPLPKHRASSMGLFDFCFLIYFFKDTNSFIAQGVACQSMFDSSVRMQNPLVGNEAKKAPCFKYPAPVFPAQHRWGISALLCCQLVFCCIWHLQVLHYDGSWSLVSCSSSLSKHENLVLRVVFRIRLCQ